MFVEDKIYPYNFTKGLQCLFMLFSSFYSKTNFSSKSLYQLDFYPILKIYTMSNTFCSSFKICNLNKKIIFCISTYTLYIYKNKKDNIHKAKLKILDDQTNINKYRVAANMKDYHIISKLVLLENDKTILTWIKAIISSKKCV